MVGKTSEQLESGGRVGINVDDNDKKLKEEIAPYLLLHHHNYAAKPIEDYNILNKKPNEKHRALLRRRSNIKTANNKNNTKRFKEIRPKTATMTTTKNIDIDQNIIYESEDNNNDDININDDNYITIIVQDEDDMDTNEVIIDETKLQIDNNNNNNLLSPKYCPSFTSSPSSDNGYESFDSPSSSFNDNDSTNDEDIWDASVGELFPSLL